MNPSMTASTDAIAIRLQAVSHAFAGRPALCELSADIRRGVITGDRKSVV